jgi:hypothetical protein
MLPGGENTGGGEENITHEYLKNEFGDNLEVVNLNAQNPQKPQSSIVSTSLTNNQQRSIANGTTILQVARNENKKKEDEKQQKKRFVKLRNNLFHQIERIIKSRDEAKKSIIDQSGYFYKFSTGSNKKTKNQIDNKEFEKKIEFYNKFLKWLQVLLNKTTSISNTLSTHLLNNKLRSNDEKKLAILEKYKEYFEKYDNPRSEYSKIVKNGYIGDKTDLILPPLNAN